MQWTEAQDRLRTPPFAPFQPAIARLPKDRWPGHADLDAAAEGVVTARGQPVSFVAPRPPQEGARPYYERRVADTGEIETRPENWHDLFNALAWIAYPKAKAAINAQHAAILEEGGEEEAKHRGSERDALTLFDESGVVVASNAPDLLRLIVDHEWKELFWNRRAEFDARVRFLTFGHSLAEKALDPRTGIGMKSVFVPVDDFFFMLPVEAQVARVDEKVAVHFAQRMRFASPKSMASVPAMGIPGWHPDNADEGFYNDPVHFRSKPHGPA
jgi:hypothetical protein